MRAENTDLTAAEWNVMECLWEKAPRTGREAVEYLTKTVGWSRSTTLTLLRRMSAKGIVHCYEENGMLTFSPLIKREDAELRATSSFLNRVYRGSVGMMLSAMTKKQALTQAELDELRALLNEMEEAQKDD